MNDLNDALGAASSGMRAQAARLRLVSENIANADTPGYHRKLISFEAEMDRDKAGAVSPGRVRLDRTEPEEIYDPTHPLADAEGYYQGSNVNLMIEVADAREASRSYEANLKMFEQVREMQTALMDLLRR
jgi:flagellar basal-body rod protein FlgC